MLKELALLPGSLVTNLLIAMWPNIALGQASGAGRAEPLEIDFDDVMTSSAAAAAAGARAAADEDASGEETEDEHAEALAETATTSAPRGPVASAELDDVELARLWTEGRSALGSISLGQPDAGRLVNGVPFPEDSRWYVVDPPNTWATEETVKYLTAAISEVHRRFPDTPPIRINHISAQEGGYLSPHSTHQAGRDVDLGFYYPPNADRARVHRERTIDLPRTWALLRALATETDVELILLDRRIQKVLGDYARSIGEDREWLDTIFHGPRSLVHHARRHRDHLHIRFYSPRAQELGRRVQPLLGQDEKQPQLVRHRIRSGDSLGAISRKYGVSIAALRRVNGMKNDFLRAGRALVVPTRSSAFLRPTPVQELVLPPRRLPPEGSLAQSGARE